jgi:hypothetical protein
MAGQRSVMLRRAINAGRRQLPTAALRDLAVSDERRFGDGDSSAHAGSRGPVARRVRPTRRSGCAARGREGQSSVRKATSAAGTSA